MTQDSSSGGDLLHAWRQTLKLEPGDVREKALRHHRFDLWYGVHHLRFTRTEAAHGAVLLRLEERARLRGPADAGPPLLTGASLSPRFVYQETVRLPRPSRPALAGLWAPDSPALRRGRTFFDRAAASLDRRDAGAAGVTPAVTTSSATSSRTPMPAAASRRRKAG